MGGDRFQRARDAPPDVVEARQPRTGLLVHVQVAPDLDHDRAHPKVLLIEAHRHERAGERSVDRHAPADLLLEGAHRDVAQPVGRVALVRPDADVGPVRGLVVFVGQRPRREAVSVEQQAGSMCGERGLDGRRQGRQDTSPLQLALFVRLHSIAGRSTWVGDRKQCIFEFAGADPQLMEAVTAWAAGSGGETPHLDKNWRSRPELVEACSTLFAAAFARHGYKPDEIEVEPKRRTPKGLAKLPPLGLFWLEAGNQDEAAAALAEGVRRLLDTPKATPVVDRSTGEVRDVRGGDVAVLVATNHEAATIATELARRGVRATVARAGLLSTPEGSMVQASLSILVNPRDDLSRAVLVALTGFGGRGAEAWLDARIAAVSQRKEAKADGETPQIQPTPEPVARIESLRSIVETLAPSEALDAVLAALDLAELCARWPDPEQRLANLDAVRSLTADYEEHCAHQREAATIAGLLRYFEEASIERLARDEEIASDDQHVGAGEHAVTIATYHRAKGLEWPVVILSSLDRGEKRDAFEVCPETDRAAFDAVDLLGGRWIRYWPWPFGQLSKTRLTQTAAASVEGRAVNLREERERVRLLYVGFTRARDHLILAARTTKKGPAVKWLEELCDSEARPLLGLPDAPDARGTSVVQVRGPEGQVITVPARHWLLGTGADEPERLASTDSHVWFAKPAGPRVDRPTYWISPSQAESDWPDLAVPKVVETKTIGERLPLGDSKGGELGRRGQRRARVPRGRCRGDG